MMMKRRAVRQKDGFSGKEFISLLLCALIASVFLVSNQALAIPAFTRATGMACSSCHTAWPKLSRFGRAFKENGYALERGNAQNQLEVGNQLSIPNIPPVAFVLNSRPFDRVKGGKAKIRALHELEVLAGASLMKYGSFFAEVEMEDEENFDPKLAHAWGGIHPHQAFNVIAGYSSIFTADPYNTLSDMRRLTRAHSAATDLGFRTGVNLRGATQMVSVYGRDPFLNRVFYMFTYSADRNGDVEGSGADDYAGRAVVDVTKDLSLGVFGIAGQQGDLDFTRVGGDAQLQHGPFNAELVYINARDDEHVDPSPRDSNSVLSGEFYLTLNRKVLGNLPPWFFQFVPLMRLDYFTIPNLRAGENNQKRLDLTTTLTYYAVQNAKVSFEYAQQLHGDGDARRVTLFLVFAL